MAFLADLRAGTHGIRLDLPSSIRIQDETAGECVLRDDARAVDWHLGFTWLMVDLSQAHSGLLMTDLERDARSAFDATFHARRAEASARQGARRTSDLDWSPLVSVQRATVGGSESVIVIHRLAYEPGDETVAGRVLIPLEKGTVHLSALSQATFTGYRETLVTHRSLQEHLQHGPRPAREHPLSEAEAVEEVRQALPSQAQIDDPALDAAVPDHPLSRVRAALSWLLSSGPTIEVTQPFRGSSGSSIELVTAGCAITPPPRFLFAPLLAERMSVGLAPFTRATLPGVGCRTFDVWRLPDVEIRGIGRRWRLKRLAMRTLRRWGREGARDTQVDTWSLPALDGRPRVGSYVRFRTAAGPEHSVAHWIADHDGTVFRLAAAGPLHIEKEELEHDVEFAATTWHRRTL